MPKSEIKKDLRQTLRDFKVATRLNHILLQHKNTPEF